MQYLKALFGASVLALLVDATPIAAQSFLNIAESVVEEHPRVQSAESLAQAGRSDASAARAALRPQLGLSADVGWDGRGSTARAGRYFLPEITASQLMFDGGRTAANTRRRSLRAQSLDRQQDRVVDELLATLAQAWGEWSRQRELIAVGEAQVAALEQIYALVGEIANFDRGRGSDVVLVSSRLEQARSAVDARRIARDESRATIREIAALPIEPAGDLPPFGRLLPATLVQANALIAETPTIALADLQIAESNAAVDGARNWWQPQVNLEVARTSERTALGDTHLFNGFGVRLRAVAIPLGSGGQATLAAARSTASASRTDAAQARQALSDRVARLWMLTDERRGRLDRLSKVVEEADRARDTVYEQFRIGRRSILDLLSYESERFNARATLASEKHDLIAAQYQLMAALGRIDTLLDGPVASQEAAR